MDHVSVLVVAVLMLPFAAWFPPATTKGDLMVHDGSKVIRVGVGTNGQVLTADSAEDSGLKWAAGGGGGTKDHAYLTLSATQTTDLTADDPIQFDQRDGGITFDSVNYQVTLSAGVKYELEYMVLPVFSGATGNIDVRPYNVTDSEYLPISSINRSRATSATTDQIDSILGKAVITPSTDIDVEFRIGQASAISSIIAGSSGGYLSWAFIREL